MDSTVHEILQTRVLESGAIPFSRGSSQPRDQTPVSRIADRFLTSWATREGHILIKEQYKKEIKKTETEKNPVGNSVNNTLQ